MLIDSYVHFYQSVCMSQSVSECAFMCTLTKRRQLKITRERVLIPGIEVQT